MVESWNGSTWTRQSIASPAANHYLDGISCSSASTCTAIGVIRTGQGEPLAEHK